MIEYKNSRKLSVGLIEGLCKSSRFEGVASTVLEQTYKIGNTFYLYTIPAFCRTAVVVIIFLTLIILASIIYGVPD